MQWHPMSSRNLYSHVFFVWPSDELQHEMKGWAR
jgi:hypothetical protein